MKKLLYVGSSWAARSFTKHYEERPTATDRLGIDYTNLAHELGLDVVNLSQFSISNLSCCNLIQQYDQPYDGVVWVYCEPIKDLGYNNISSIKEFLQSPNFWSIRQNINSVILKKMSELDCPIALIGGASDVETADYDNLTVIHPSWQKFLAETAGVDLEHGWSADIAHHEMGLYPRIHPSAGLVDLMTDTFDAWKKLEKKDIFINTHPNVNGTQLFAGHIKSSLNTWLDSI